MRDGLWFGTGRFSCPCNKVYEPVTPTKTSVRITGKRFKKQSFLVFLVKIPQPFLEVSIMVFADVVLVVRITAIANADALDRESKNIQLQLCLQPCEKEDTGAV